jgi:enterochelin esterase-like enzyme
MRRLSRTAAVAFAALACAGGAAATPLAQTRAVDATIASVALRGTVHARVFLPQDYDDATGRSYPVVYFLHGLPASSDSYRGNVWLAEALAHAGSAILVLPQGARDDDSDAEYLDWGAGRNWETYLARELPRFVDAHFRTIRSRSARALVGLSAGGYGATIIGIHHPGTFSVIESWSGYFHPTDPTGTRALDRGAAANVHTLVPRLRRDSQYFGFYVGRSDTRFRAENVQLDRELTAARAPHVFALYPGGHETALWQAHAVVWLRLAVAQLTPATR